MTIIKLTDRITNHIIYVNKNYITRFYVEKPTITNEKYTIVFTIERNFFSVKETPEEIIALIKETEKWFTLNIIKIWKYKNEKSK